MEGGIMMLNDYIIIKINNVDDITQEMCKNNYLYQIGNTSHGYLCINGICYSYNLEDPEFSEHIINKIRNNDSSLDW